MNSITHQTHMRRSLFDDWAYARPYLMPAMHMIQGLYTEEDLIAGVLSGQMRLWVGNKCAAVTQILQYPRAKVMNTLIAGAETGYMKNLLDLSKDHEQFCIDNDCLRIQITGRRGWEKLFPDFKFKSITLTKDII